MAEKLGEARPIRFEPGLWDDICQLASRLERDPSWVVRRLCDESLYHRSYKFPFHKEKYTLNSTGNEGNDGDAA